MKKELELEVGKIYLDRKGEKRTIQFYSDTAGNSKPFTDDYGRRYDYDGRYFTEGQSDYDLIAEVGAHPLIDVKLGHTYKDEVGIEIKIIKEEHGSDTDCKFVGDCGGRYNKRGFSRNMASLIEEIEPDTQEGSLTGEIVAKPLELKEYPAEEIGAKLDAVIEQINDYQDKIPPIQVIPDTDKDLPLEERLQYYIALLVFRSKYTEAIDLLEILQ